MLILQTATPDYRKKFFDYLNEHIDDFQLFTGQNYFEESIKTDNRITYKQPVKNVYLLKRKFLFQTGMWKAVMRASVVVLEMNPRIISNWLILIFRGIRGKKTILWGHAWPRKGKNSRSDIIRNFMRKLGSSIIVYTKTQEKELKQKMPTMRITSAPNALFFKREMGVIPEDISLVNNLIYVGRLAKDKKVLFLVKAFHRIVNQLPDSTMLIIIGSGEQMILIEKYLEENSLKKRIVLLGHVSDYKTLKKNYATTLVSISPGTAGLSLIQSFGFGVPMLISKNEKHGPEIEAIIKNQNAVFFETDNNEDLGRKILGAYNNKTKWVSSRETICAFCKENYSIESMAKIFIKNNIK